MNMLLKDLMWLYLLFLAGIGALSLLLGMLTIRDWWKCKRHQIESENRNIKSGSVGDLGKNDMTI